MKGPKTNKLMFATFKLYHSINLIRNLFIICYATKGVLLTNDIVKKDDEIIDVKPEEAKAIETTKKPFLPTRAMLKTIEMKLELKRYTKEQIAEACGITRMTLHRWERNPDYQDLYMKRSWEVLRQFQPTVNKALQIAILKQDVQAIKLYYQLTENIREAMDITFTFGGNKDDN
jgi:transcriptional regulator with XRE-family HTH domain